MTNKQYKPNPAKLKLIELSKKARNIRDFRMKELEQVEGPQTINNIIISLFYPKGTFHTFKDWKEEGYKIKKGSKGFPVWSRKRKLTKKDEETGENKEYKAFCLAYLFHDSQVEAAQ